MSTSERKCDTCTFRAIDRFGDYCDCEKSPEYGLKSIYGWCDFYDPDKVALEKHRIEKEHSFG